MVPEISFIIPAYNESHYIRGCLQAIVRYCGEVGIRAETIVVDNGSTDDTPELAGQIADAVYILERGSVSQARNFGVSKSLAPIIAFIDADVLLTRTWVDTFAVLREQILADGNTLTGYQYAIREDKSWIEKHWFGNLHDRYLAGGNMIFSRQLLDKVGGFDTGLKTGEDYDICERSIAAGANYYEEPGFEAIHLGFPRTLSHFVKREIWHGEGDFQSFGRFVKSPVAIIAVVYLLLQLLILVALISANWRTGLMGLALLLLINAALSVVRFRHCSVAALLHNSVLNYFYFSARSCSLFTVLHKAGKAY